MAEIKFYQDAAKTHQVYPEINPDGIYPGVTVGLADNLTSDEGIIDTSTWQFRGTACGEEDFDVSDGYATLRNLIGSTTSSTIEEDLTYEINATGVQSVNITQNTFKTAINNTTGYYDFIYDADISYSSALINTFNKTTFATRMNQTPGTYTFTYTAEITRSSTPANLVSSFNSSTFIAKVNEIPNTYNFVYSYDELTATGEWALMGQAVNLSQYGITLNGTPSDGNSIVINYGSNTWYYSGNGIDPTYYGITTTGTEHVGDTFSITYTKNEWNLSVLGQITENITLANYGITIASGTPVISDNIQVHFIAQETGAVITSYPYYLRSLGTNQFNIDAHMYLDNCSLEDNQTPEVISETGKYLVYFKCWGGETYTIHSSSATAVNRAAYSPKIPKLGDVLTRLAQTGTASSGQTVSNHSTPTTTVHYTPENDGYICVSMNSLEDVCCHLTWEGLYEEDFESYYQYDFPIPYTDDNGTLIREYGLVNLDDTTEYYDEIDFVAGKWYERTTRIAYSVANLEMVQALDVPYMYDSNYIYYGIDTVSHDLPTSSSDYRMSNYGTEEFIGANTMPCTASIFYQDNLKDKVRFSMEVIDNKVTSLSSSSTDIEYPSAACMQKYMNGTTSMGDIKANSLTLGSNASTSKLTYGAGGREDSAFTYDQYGSATLKSSAGYHCWNLKNSNGTDVIKIYPNGYNANFPSLRVVYPENMMLDLRINDTAVPSDTTTTNFREKVLGVPSTASSWHRNGIGAVRPGNYLIDFLAGKYAPTLTWSAGDTHGFLSVSYQDTAIKATIGAGGSNKINWYGELPVIISTGTGTYGRYIKYSDGTMICAGSASLGNVAFDTQYGTSAIYYNSSNKNVKNITFPAEFNAAPDSVVVTVGSNGYLSSCINSYSRTTCNTYCYANGTGTWNNVKLYYYAIGKWK